jgi:hypothetical protein
LQPEAEKQRKSGRKRRSVATIFACSHFLNFEGGRAKSNAPLKPSRLLLAKPEAAPLQALSGDPARFRAKGNGAAAFEVAKAWISHLPALRGIDETPMKLP